MTWRICSKPTRGRASIDIRYLLEVVAALNKLRRDARDVEVAYLRRLTVFAASNPGTLDSSDLDPGAPLFEAQWRWIGRRLHAIVGVIRAVSLIPFFLIQAAKLIRLRRRVEAQRCVVVALASNRLSLSGGAAEARTNLAALVRSLRDGPDGTVAKKISSADHVLVFDPLPLSKLWGQREKCWRDGVLIVDGAFLLTFFVIGLLVGFPRQWIERARLTRECRRAMRSWSGPRAPRFWRAALSVLVTDTCADVLRSSGQTEAVFLTCHSTLTELLRAYLVQWRGCKRIDEVMHGIGSIQAEGFFAAVLSAGREFNVYEKHFFIPQVPNLPLYGVFERQARLGTGFAINPYLNQYLIEHAREASSVDAFIRSEYRAIRYARHARPGQQREGEPEPVIIAVLGNTPYDRRLFTSPSFNAECLLVSTILECQEAIEPDCLIVYVPHPVHASAEFTHPIFSHDRVRVHKSSVFCWLIADACVSLLSSSLFEAVYFGAHGFTPLIAHDNFYTQSYLDLVSHPKSGSFADFTAGLRDFLVRQAQLERAGVIAKARKRLEAMRADAIRAALARVGAAAEGISDTPESVTRARP